MNTLQTIPHQNFTAWEQQGKAAKQWLGRLSGQLNWLTAYTRSQNCSMDWIDTSHVTLRDMPLLGQYLAALTELSIQEQTKAEASFKNRALSDDDFSVMNGFSDFKNHMQTGYKKQDRNKIKQSSVSRKPGLQAKHAEPAESISRVGRIPAQANYSALRQWSETPSPDQSSNFEALNFEAVDKEVSVHSLPEHLRRKRQPAVSNSNAVRQTQSKDQKEWIVYALRRVNKMLIRENENVKERWVSDTIKKKHFKSFKRVLLLAEQWKSVLQDQQISHQLLMSIIAETAPISRSKKINNQDDLAAVFTGGPERGTVIHKAPDKASFGSQRSDNRQQKITPVTHEKIQSELEIQIPPVLQRESSVQSWQQQQEQTAISPDFLDSPHQLKTLENQATESLLGGTANNPAEIQQNDEELAMQIKRILDEEARRYGIDV